MDNNNMELNYEEMGRRVREVRNAREITQEDLAAAIGVTSATIKSIEYGEKGLLLKNFYKLVRVLDVSADYILCLTDHPAVKEYGEKKKRAMEKTWSMMDGMDDKKCSYVADIAWMINEKDKSE